MGSDSFSASARISEASWHCGLPDHASLQRQCAPYEPRVSANSLPKPVLEPVMRTTCLEFMIVRPMITYVCAVLFPPVGNLLNYFCNQTPYFPASNCVHGRL